MTILWTASALADLDSAFEFISAAHQAAAKKMVGKVLESLEQLSLFPLSGRLGRVKGTRELLVFGTPFIIVYRPKPRQLEVLAILHASRKWP